MARKPGDWHEAQIDITVSNGKVGAYFSKYNGRSFIPPKLWSRDDDSPKDQSRITPISPANQRVKFSGAGFYILDISDWDDSPAVSVTLTIDDVLRFKGSGHAGNIEQWSDKVIGPGVRIEPDRKLIVDLRD